MVKHDSYYYLFYSGNWQSTYAIGVARASSIKGPYEKHGDPILRTTNNPSLPLQGSGHCS